MEMKARKLGKSTTVVVLGALWLFMGMPSGELRGEPAGTEYKLKIPFGLEETAVVIPADNPLTKEKVELGRLLFFDKRLSKNNTIACASCHLAQFSFTDGKNVSTGIHGQKGGRSAPASMNRLFSKAQFWDGRAATLEE